MPYIPSIRVVGTRGYDGSARKLFSEAERTAAELEIALAPTAWPVIAGTGGARRPEQRAAGAAGVAKAVVRVSSTTL